MSSLGFVEKLVEPSLISARWRMDILPIPESIG
jgi:hypothetical protein